MSLAPPPITEDSNSFIAKEWLNKLYAYVGGATGNIAWTQVSKTGSNLSDLAVKNHSSLNGIAGSNDGYHITSAEYSSLSSGLTTTIALAKLTAGGTNGSITVANGIVTGYTAPT